MRISVSTASLLSTSRHDNTTGSFLPHYILVIYDLKLIFVLDADNMVSSTATAAAVQQDITLIVVLAVLVPLVLLLLVVVFRKFNRKDRQDGPMYEIAASGEFLLI